MSSPKHPQRIASLDVVADALLDTTYKITSDKFTALNKSHIYWIVFSSRTTILAYYLPIYKSMTKEQLRCLHTRQWSSIDTPCAVKKNERQRMLMDVANWCLENWKDDRVFYGKLSGGTTQINNIATKDRPLALVKFKVKKEYNNLPFNKNNWTQIKWSNITCYYCI